MDRIGIAVPCHTVLRVGGKVSIEKSLSDLLTILLKRLNAAA
jgi:hypothetical protein